MTDRTRHPAHHLEAVDDDQWAARGADVFATAIDEAIAVRGRCLFGISGGDTPEPVFRNLAERDLPWSAVTLVQVDERLAPSGSPDRNLTLQHDVFGHLPVEWLLLPVDRSFGRPTAAFVESLQQLGGTPPVLDVVHLGLGDDGHTASLIPGDEVVDELDEVVALSDEYRGWRRLTLTRPVLDRARLVVWLVRGEAKRVPLRHLLGGSTAIPAGLLQPVNSIVIADRAAASD